MCRYEDNAYVFFQPFQRGLEMEGLTVYENGGKKRLFQIGLLIFAVMSLSRGIRISVLMIVTHRECIAGYVKDPTRILLGSCLSCPALSVQITVRFFRFKEDHRR